MLIKDMFMRCWYASAHAAIASTQPRPSFGARALDQMIWHSDCVLTSPKGTRDDRIVAHTRPLRVRNPIEAGYERRRNRNAGHIELGFGRSGSSTRTFAIFFLPPINTRIPNVLSIHKTAFIRADSQESMYELLPFFSALFGP